MVTWRLLCGGHLQEFTQWYTGLSVGVTPCTMKWTAHVGAHWRIQNYALLSSHCSSICSAQVWRSANMLQWNVSMLPTKDSFHHVHNYGNLYFCLNVYLQVNVGKCGIVKIIQSKFRYWSTVLSEPSIIRTSEPSKSAGQSTNVCYSIDVHMCSRVQCSHCSLCSCEQQLK